MNDSEKHAREYSEDQVVLIQAKDLKPGHWFCRGIDDRPLFNAYYVSSPVHQLETSVIFFIEMSHCSENIILFNPNSHDAARVKEKATAVEFDEITSQIKRVSLQLTFQPPDTPMYVLKPEFAPSLSQKQREEREHLEWRFGILSVGNSTTIEEMKKALEDIIDDPSPQTTEEH